METYGLWQVAFRKATQNQMIRSRNATYATWWRFYPCVGGVSVCAPRRGATKCHQQRQCGVIKRKIISLSVLVWARNYFWSRPFSSAPNSAPLHLGLMEIYRGGSLGG